MAADEQNDDWTTILREEVLWLLRTLGVIALSLAVGRLITYLTRGGGIDLSLLQGNWQQQVDAALRERETTQRNPSTQDKEHDA